jgi:hypothetical protein
MCPTNTIEVSELIQMNYSVLVKGDFLKHCMCYIALENILSEDASGDKDGYTL